MLDRYAVPWQMKLLGGGGRAGWNALWEELRKSWATFATSVPRGAAKMKWRPICESSLAIRETNAVHAERSQSLL